MRSIRFFILAAVMILTHSSWSQLATTSSLVDMGTASFIKPFHSFEAKSTDIWVKKDHFCQSDPNSPILKFWSKIPKYSQSNMESSIKSNVMLSNQIITTPEMQFLQSKTVSSNDGLTAFNCVSGFEVPKSTTLDNNINYFEKIISQIRFIEAKQADKHYLNGKAYAYKILDSAPTLDMVMNDPSHIGVLLSVRGGHCLGSSLEITSGYTNTPDYEKKILRNVDRLKGVEPLSDFSKDYLTTPIFSFSFASEFEDGLIGKNRIPDIEREKVFGMTKSIGGGLSPLAIKVIQKLVSDKSGRRILIDVNGMTPQARKWYYEYVENQRVDDEVFPIFATNAVISNQSMTSPQYTSEDTPNKNQKSYFSLYQSALTKQDISAIVESKGLICLSLDARQLTAGTIFEQKLKDVVPGSLQEKDLAVKIIVANLCQIIYFAQGQKTWDHIAVSSNFDYFSQPFSGYSSASELGNLMRDIKKFINEPQDIYDLYTADQVAEFFYGMSGDDITKKIFSENAQRFIKENLTNTPPDKQQQAKE